MWIGKWMGLMKADLERQPLALFGQAISILVAITLVVWGASRPTTQSGFSYVLSNSSIALAVILVLSSALATGCRLIFAKSIIAGFFSTLVSASVCLVVFVQSATMPLIKTTSQMNGSYVGPLIDISYWAVFSIFVSVCASAAISRMQVTWGNAPTTTEDGSVQKIGLADFEIVIFAAVWGWCLSGSQQKIIGAFVFEKATADGAAERA